MQRLISSVTARSTLCTNMVITYTCSYKKNGYDTLSTPNFFKITLCLFIIKNTDLLVNYIFMYIYNSHIFDLLLFSHSLSLLAKHSI
jgi:hypothetical protein